MNIGTQSFIAGVAKITHFKLHFPGSAIIMVLLIKPYFFKYQYKIIT